MILTDFSVNSQPILKAILQVGLVFCINAAKFVKIIYHGLCESGAGFREKILISNCLELINYDDH